MHLLVLSAFRPTRIASADAGFAVSMHLLVLSAFRLKWIVDIIVQQLVSMHLLVLSAFRLSIPPQVRALEMRSQCTFWCSVLSDRKLGGLSPSAHGLNAPFGAQCFPTHCQCQEP